MSQRITIQISKKVATCLTELPIVCGNSDYECEFLFDEEWDNHSIKTARFRDNGEYTDVVFEGNVCKMPIISNAKIVWVGVFAGELSTSTPAIVHCKPSILDGEDTPAPPREDVYSQIIGLCDEAVNTAKSVEDRANKGEFDGKDADTEAIKQYSDSTFANALKGSASGEVARLDDVSPLAHELAVKVKSKNLFNREATIYNGGTLVFEGNTQIFTSTGTAKNLTTTLGNYKDFVGKTITVSYELVEVKSTAGRTTFNTYIQTDTGTVIAQKSNLEADGKTFKLTAKIPEDGTATSLVIRQYVGYVIAEAGDYVKIANTQVEYGKTPTTYTPYIEDVNAVKVCAQGKNFFDNDVSKIEEVTYTGASGAHGQRNGYTLRLPAGTYVCHAKYKGGSIPEANTYIYGVLNTKDGAYKQTVMLKQATNDFTVVVTIEEGDILYIYDGVKQLLKQSQKVFEGVEVQVEAGETATAFEPYVEPVEYAQNDKIAPIYPTTTLTTDTTGALIECQYNRDINKAFAELVNAIIALGGNV